MIGTAAAHRERPWRVHTLAPDFRLEDVWTFELAEVAPRDAREFLTCFWSVFDGLAGSWLMKVRLEVGRAMRWDDHDFALPIPGCTETTLHERLDDADRKRCLAPDDARSPVPSPKVKTVYVFHDEALYELSNDTIHALLHVGITGAWPRSRCT